MEVKLSDRLLAIAERIPQGSTLADIGSDHALLPVYAVKHGLVKRAIAGEINNGPLMAARKQIADAGLESVIVARKADGLEAVQPGEVNVVTIAGMGGSTMEAILERGNQQGRLNGVDMLILQPNVGEAAVRRWLLGNGWLLKDETILKEDGLFYEILTAVPARLEEDILQSKRLYESITWGSVIADQELQLLMGPYLLRRPNDVFMEKWFSELEKRDRILAQMNQSDSEEARQKRQLLLHETEKIKEVLTCLRTDKPSSN